MSQNDQIIKRFKRIFNQAIEEIKPCVEAIRSEAGKLTLLSNVKASLNDMPTGLVETVVCRIALDMPRKTTKIAGEMKKQMHQKLQTAFVLFQVFGLAEGLKHDIFLEAFTRDNLETPYKAQIIRFIILSGCVDKNFHDKQEALANMYSNFVSSTDQTHIQNEVAHGEVGLALAFALKLLDLCLACGQYSMTNFLHECPEEGGASIADGTSLYKQLLEKKRLKIAQTEDAISQSEKKVANLLTKFTCFPVDITGIPANASLQTLLDWKFVSGAVNFNMSICASMTGMTKQDVISLRNERIACCKEKKIMPEKIETIAYLIKPKKKPGLKQQLADAEARSESLQSQLESERQSSAQAIANLKDKVGVYETVLHSSKSLLQQCQVTAQYMTATFAHMYENQISNEMANRVHLQKQFEVMHGITPDQSDPTLQNLAANQHLMHAQQQLQRSNILLIGEQQQFALNQQQQFAQNQQDQAYVENLGQEEGASPQIEEVGVKSEPIKKEAKGVINVDEEQKNEVSGEMVVISISDDDDVADDAEAVLGAGEVWLDQYSAVSKAKKALKQQTKEGSTELENLKTAQKQEMDEFKREEKEKLSTLDKKHREDMSALQQKRIDASTGLRIDDDDALEQGIVEEEETLKKNQAFEKTILEQTSASELAALNQRHEKDYKDLKKLNASKATKLGQKLAEAKRQEDKAFGQYEKMSSNPTRIIKNEPDSQQLQEDTQQQISGAGLTDFKQKGAGLTPTGLASQGGGFFGGLSAPQGGGLSGFDFNAQPSFMQAQQPSIGQDTSGLGFGNFGFTNQAGRGLGLLGFTNQAGRGWDGFGSELRGRGRANLGAQGARGGQGRDQGVGAHQGAGHGRGGRGGRGGGKTKK